MWHWGIVFGCWDPVTWSAKQSPILSPTSARHITSHHVTVAKVFAEGARLDLELEDVWESGWIWMSLVQLARLLNMAFIGILCSGLHAMLHPGSVEAVAGCWSLHSKILVLRCRCWGNSVDFRMHPVLSMFTPTFAFRVGLTDLSLPDVCTTIQFQTRNQHPCLYCVVTVFRGSPLYTQLRQLAGWEFWADWWGAWYNPKLSLCFLTVPFDGIIWHHLASFDIIWP